MPALSNGRAWPNFKPTQHSPRNLPCFPNYGPDYTAAGTSHEDLYLEF